MTESVVDCPCIPLITQLLVHEYNIEGTFVVDDIISSFIDKSESILMFKLNLTVFLSKLLINIFLLTQRFANAHCKRY